MWSGSISLYKYSYIDLTNDEFSGHHDVYRICAFSEEERETWIGCVKWVKPNYLTNYSTAHVMHTNAANP